MERLVPLEKAAEAVCEANSKPPLIFQLPPAKGRQVLEFVHIPEIEEPERIQKKARRRTILFWCALSLYLILLIVVSILSGIRQSGL